jgi:threonine dehydratase
MPSARRSPDEEAVAVRVRGAARFVQVSDPLTEQAMRLQWQDTQQMPEPAGNIALAACWRTPHAPPVRLWR